MTHLDKQLGEDVVLGAGVRFLGRGRIVLGDYVVLEDGVVIDLGSSGHGLLQINARSKIKIGTVLRCYSGRISIGNRVTVNEYCVLSAHGGIAIGDHSMIASHSVLHAATHLTDADIPTRYQGERALGITVGQNVWIGTHVTILDGVVIGDGSVIGAGAVVINSIPQSCLAVGVPARIVRPVKDNEDVSILKR